MLAGFGTSGNVYTKTCLPKRPGARPQRFVSSCRHLFSRRFVQSFSISLHSFFLFLGADNQARCRPRVLLASVYLYVGLNRSIFFKALLLSFSFSRAVVRVVVKLQVETTEVPIMIPGVPFGLFWHVCAVLCCECDFVKTQH